MPNVKRKPRKRATQAVQLEREQAALELVGLRAGSRQYVLESAFMERFPGLTRRQASNYISRARERLADALEDRIADLAASLPGEIRRTLDGARANGNWRVVVNVLRLISDLWTSSQRDGGPDDEVGEVIFEVVDSVPDEAEEGVPCSNFG